MSRAMELLDMALAALVPPPHINAVDNRTCSRCGARKGKCNHHPRWLV